LLEKENGLDKSGYFKRNIFDGKSFKF